MINLKLNQHKHNEHKASKDRFETQHQFSSPVRKKALDFQKTKWLKAIAHQNTRVGCKKRRQDIV